MKIVKILSMILPTIVVAIAVFWIYRDVTVNKTIEQLLSENQDLKTAISNLSQEEQIGYAKVISQSYKEGSLYTTLLFVETAPGDPTKQILRKEFEIEGDIVHFDAIIVKFTNELVADGKERAMYMWRRVYGENTPPQQGFDIEEPGKPSPRYAQLSKKLSIDDSRLFWREIWQLSNDPTKLEKSGIKAIFGNVVYKQLKPGLIYVFKVNATGGLYPETIPAL